MTSPTDPNSPEIISGWDRRLGRVALSKLEAVISRLFSRVDEARDESEELKHDVAYLKRRIAYLEKLAAREKERAAEELCKLEARIVKELLQEVWEKYVPRSMFYPTNAVVWSLATTHWKDPDDGPTEMSDVQYVQDGFEKWGVHYVG